MSMRTYRIRLFQLGVLSLLIFTAIIARLYYLQILCHEEYAQFARQQQNMLVQLIPRRGDITDRNGIILATSHFSNNIILDTSRFVIAPSSAMLRELADLTQIPEKELRELFKLPQRKVLAANAGAGQKARLLEAARNFQKHYKMPAGTLKAEPAEGSEGTADNIVLDTAGYSIKPDPRMVRELARLVGKAEETIQMYFKRPRRYILARMASEELENKVREAILVWQQQYKVPREAFVFEQNSERENPHDTLASHIVGYTNIDGNGDNVGTAGIEREYDRYLKGSVTTQTLPVTQTRKGLMPLKDEIIEATYGNNVVLTIDHKIQMFTESALQKRVGEVQAKGGIAIVMDVRSGEILALASCPDYNLNEYSKADPAQLRNRTLTDPIEIGSVMKILTTTLLIDKGLLSADEPVNCQHMHGVVDGRRFTDTHDQGVVPFREAFAASSNIALATVGLRLEPVTYYDGLVAFGLGQCSGVDLPGEGPGLLRPVERWTRLSRTSLPIGYECSLTAMEVIAALGAIGNDGWRMRPHLVKEIRTHTGELVKSIKPERVARVASPQTCTVVRDLMEGVVTMSMGTGENARIPGYRIGGKTGTSVKTPPGVTPKKYIASFAGLLPIQAPRLAVYVYVDEPVLGKYGGDVAAPIFRQIALHATQILGIPPDDPAAYGQIEQELANDLLIADSGTSSTTSSMALAAAVAPAEEAAEAVSDLEAFQEEAFQEMASPEDLLLPRMPDCRGKTIPEAWQTLSEAGITSGVKTLGSGLMVRQEPPAGAPVRPENGVTLIFAHPSETSKSIGTPASIHAQ